MIKAGANTSTRIADIRARVRADVQAVPAILIVDDEYAIRFSLENFFSDQGFAPRCAASAEEALSLLDRERFAVAVVDLRLHGASGEALISTASARFPDLKFLIYTGSASYRVPAALRRIGMDDSHVLIKPIADLGEIAARALALIEHRQ